MKIAASFATGSHLTKQYHTKLKQRTTKLIFANYLFLCIVNCKNLINGQSFVEHAQFINLAQV